MDFFTVKGSSKWDDTPADKQLHTSLFLSPTTSSQKTLKKTKTQKLEQNLQQEKTTVEKKKRKLPPQHESTFTNIKKQQKNKPEIGKIIHPDQVQDAGTDTPKHANKYVLADGEDSKPQSPKKKKKRKRKNSQGEGRRDSVGDNNAVVPEQKKLVNKPSANSHDIPTSPTRGSNQLSTTDDKQNTGNVDGEETTKKKKRKRKPRHNKFKDADGNVKPQFKKPLDPSEIQKSTPNLTIQKSTPSPTVPKAASMNLMKAQPSSVKISKNSYQEKKHEKIKSIGTKVQTFGQEEEADKSLNKNSQKKIPVKKHESKSEKKHESKSSSGSKMDSFEQAKKEAIKRRNRMHKRRRSVSESSNPEVEAQNLDRKTKTLSEISKSLDSDTNNNAVRRKQNGESQKKQDKNPRYKVKRNRGKKGKKQQQEDQLLSESTEAHELRTVLPKNLGKKGKKQKQDHLFTESHEAAELMTDSSEEDSLSNSEDSSEDEQDPESVRSRKKGQTQRSRLEDQLRASHFRYLNETFYQCSGSEAYDMMTKDKDAFEVYHEGYSQQVQQWPVNPVDVIIKYLKSKPSSLVIGDFGCGEAQIAQSVKQKVHSFDLCALNKHVTVCDISEVPLDDESLDVAIFCLSLMGTNWIDYVKEANRVLKTGGTLKVAEVASRFHSLAGFLKIMKSLGFQSSSKNLSNKVFYSFDFTKQKASRDIDVNKGEILKPCLYKKR